MRTRGWQRIRWLDNITDSMDMNMSKLWEIVEVREAWCDAVHRITVRHDLATKQQDCKVLSTEFDTFVVTYKYYSILYFL